MHLHLLVSGEPGIIHLDQLARMEAQRAAPSDKSPRQRLKGGSSARRREIKITSSQVKTLSERQTSHYSVIVVCLRAPAAANHGVCDGVRSDQTLSEGRIVPLEQPILASQQPCEQSITGSNAPFYTNIHI